MADVRKYIRINPVDTDQDRAVGVSLPYDGTAVFNSTFTTQEQMKSNMLNVLLTEPGERVFKPDFGVGLRLYLFENFTDVETLRDRIRNQVERYVPQVELTDVQINKKNDSHELNVSVYYRTIVNDQLDAIQVNFSPDRTSTSSPSTGGTTGGSTGGSTGGGY